MKFLHLITSMRTPDNRTDVDNTVDRLTYPKYRPDIDGLRAVAILAVIGFHAFPNWVKGGFIGVDIFFVISGFLISTIIFSNLKHNAFSFAEFYVRRVLRIFPSLMVVLVACFILGWFVLLASEYAQLGKHIAGGAGFISNFVLWQESGYFDDAAEAKPLLHLWSLGIEEQFYLVWPLLLWFAWKRRGNLLAITMMAAILSFSYNIATSHSDEVGDFYSPQTRFWELFAGSMLAYITLQDRVLVTRLNTWLEARQMGDAVMRNVPSIIGVSLIAASMLIITKDRYFPGLWATLPVLGAVLIIAAGKHSWVNRTLLSNRVLVWFGLISFPLYLWHWPLLSFARMLKGETLGLSSRLAVLLASLVLAWMTFRLIEKPLRFGKKSRAKVAVLLILMSMVGSVGYYTYENRGLASRFPKIIREITVLNYKYTTPYRLGTCFLTPEDSQYQEHFQSCMDIQSNEKKTILLWGDSHAAHLYPGYYYRFSANANIIQLTAAGCPPILNMTFKTNSSCRGINNFVLGKIKKIKPNRVVLAARWIGHDWPNLEQTVAALKRLGIKHIDLVGPVPLWQDSLPKQLYLYFQSDPLHRIPKRISRGLVPQIPELDSAMSAFSSRIGINYISPRAVMCNDEGCVARLGETADTLTAFDNGHLTETGSRYLVSKFPNL